ncbi:MAG: hypothetical protein KatS3mg053_2743 [Candidatus Roseilinea sp.]|nr:MAG: hypothetical protein KatS3mg053_2743 [Candidatus Roseilinea sp.]
MRDFPLTLSVLPDVLAVCRLDPTATIPDWATGEGFFSVTRTADELSIVCREAHVPGDVVCERGWRALKLHGPFDFGQVGILVSVVSPLAEAGIAIFVISTYDTDYVLVKAAQLESAVAALTRSGHAVEAARDSEVIAVKCAWRLPDDARIHAAFDAEVVEYDERQDRWLVRLTGVRSTDAPAEARALVEAQAGKWAYVPSEARRLGLTLPLKYETLTGRIRFFYAADPRERR